LSLKVYPLAGDRDKKLAAEVKADACGANVSGAELWEYLYLAGAKIMFDCCVRKNHFVLLEVD
jgi:hypothetical protein